jgi:hypothetical protein
MLLLWWPAEIMDNESTIFSTLWGAIVLHILLYAEHYWPSKCIKIIGTFLYKIRGIHSVLLCEWEAVHISYSHIYTLTHLKQSHYLVHFCYLGTEKWLRILTIHDVIIFTTSCDTLLFKVLPLPSYKNWKNELNICHLYNHVKYLAKNNCILGCVFSGTDIQEISGLIRENHETQVLFF